MLIRRKEWKGHKRDFKYTGMQIVARISSVISNMWSYRKGKDSLLLSNTPKFSTKTEFFSKHRILFGT